MNDRDARRPSTGASGGKVLSITDRIEQRQMARLHEHAAKKHLRRMETTVAWLDLKRDLQTLDLDAQLQAIEEEGGPELARRRGETRSLRGLQRCLRGDVEGGFAEWEEAAAELPTLGLPHFFRGRWLMDTDPVEALIHLDRAAIVEPRDPNVYWRRGDCQARLGDHERALANYLRALTLDPASIDGLVALGSTLTSLGRPDEALRYYDQAITLAPRYVDFHAARAIAHEVLGQLEPALRDHARILELDPENLVARYSRARCHGKAGEVAVAIEELQALAAEQPEEQPIHQLLGKLLLQQGRLPEARAALDRALELGPDEHEALGQRAMVLMRLGERAGALADLERAMHLSPSSPEYVYLHIALAHDRSDHAAKIAALADPIERFPDTEVFRKQRAEHHARRGDHASALADWDTLIASFPDDAACRVGRAQSLGATGRHEEGLAEALRARELEPDHAMANALCANYREQVGGDEALVEADWIRAVALGPNELPIRYYHGRYLMERERFTEALVDFDQLTVIAPSYAEAHYRRGSCRFQLDVEHWDDEAWDEDEPAKQARFRACVADFERALSLGYDTDELFIDLHWVQRELDELDASLATLARAIERYPDNSLLFIFRGQLRKMLGDDAGDEADRLHAEELQAQARAAKASEADEAGQDTEEGEEGEQVGEGA